MNIIIIVITIVILNYTVFKAKRIIEVKNTFERFNEKTIKYKDIK